MSSSGVALTVIFAIIAVGAGIGFLAGAHRKMDLEQWTVGGRGFGVVLVYLLMAGEVYTTFSFLGASGWAYSRGGPALYIMAYLTLAYVVSFFILPQIWEEGRKYGLQTESDFFGRRYGSKYLAAFAWSGSPSSFRTSNSSSPDWGSSWRSRASTASAAHPPWESQWPS